MFERAEHRLGHTWKELVGADVPVYEESAVELGDLRVQDHLRPLGDDPHRITERVADTTMEKLAQTQCAGEYHGRQNLFSP